MKTTLLFLQKPKSLLKGFSVLFVACMLLCSNNLTAADTLNLAGDFETSQWLEDKTPTYVYGNDNPALSGKALVLKWRAAVADTFSYSRRVIEQDILENVDYEFSWHFWSKNNADSLSGIKVTWLDENDTRLDSTYLFSLESDQVFVKYTDTLTSPALTAKAEIMFFMRKNILPADNWNEARYDDFFVRVINCPGQSRSEDLGEICYGEEVAGMARFSDGTDSITFNSICGGDSTIVYTWTVADEIPGIASGPELVKLNDPIMFVYSSDVPTSFAWTGSSADVEITSGADNDTAHVVFNAAGMQTVTCEATLGACSKMSMVNVEVVTAAIHDSLTVLNDSIIKLSVLVDPAIPDSIQGLNDSLSVLAIMVSDYGDSIVGLNADVAGLNADITELTQGLADTIAYFTSMVTKLEGDITDTVAYFTSMVTKLEGDITDTVAYFNSALSDSEDVIITLNDSIAVLQTTISIETATLSSAIQAELDGLNMSVYPNPATDILNIEHNGTGSTIASVKVYTETGTLIGEELTPGTSEVQLHIGEYMSGTSGMIIIRVMDNQNNTVTFKVIVN